jgi:hypothetical protein
MPVISEIFCFQKTFLSSLFYVDEDKIDAILRDTSKNLVVFFCKLRLSKSNNNYLQMMAAWNVLPAVMLCQK